MTRPRARERFLALALRLFRTLASTQARSIQAVLSAQLSQSQYLFEPQPASLNSACHMPLNQERNKTAAAEMCATALHHHHLAL